MLKRVLKRNQHKLPTGGELSSGEEIVLMVRKHWYVFRDPFVLMFFVPFVLLSGIFFLDYLSLPFILKNILGQLSLYGSVIIFLLGFSLFVWKFYLWWNTYYIVTNKRLILVRQLGLFFHEDRETSLSMIQDVRARVNGLQATLYGYGDVTVQVSSQDAQLILEQVGRPREVQYVIVKEAHLKF